MDFIDLATATSARAIFRHLEASSPGGTDSAAAAEDDDFANLYSPSHHSSSSQQPLPEDVGAGLSSSSAGLRASPPGLDVGAAAQQRPLLSPSAEAELFMLATNFLLYVAMVIITTMVAKIYFPESLERGSAAGNSEDYDAATPRNPSVSYRMVDEDEEEDERGSSYYGSDASDVEDEEEEEEGDDDDEGGNAETEGLLIELDAKKNPAAASPRRKKRGGGTATAASEAKSRRGGGKGGGEENGGTSPIRGQLRRFSSDPGVLEFDQTTTPRAVVLKRLAWCSLMLNVTFVSWGLLQERMLTRRYPRMTGEYFTYSYALVFTNRFWTLIMSGMLMLYLKPRLSRSTVIYEYSFPSISNMLSSWCQYEALRYVSFPAATLFKSFKLAPVMLMGKILGNKAYPQYDYIVAIIIGIGITMFMSSTEGLRFGEDIYGVEISGVWTGVMLLILFLFFDSFTSQWQSRMFQRHRDLSMIELMFATSAFSTVLSFITLVHTRELWPALSFVYRHSEIHLHFFMFSICSTIGQLFIFYTIKNFGAVVFTIIMTTRVLLSIALSCILYGHQVTSAGFLGLMLVMGAVCYRIKKKGEGTHLIKWQGMGDDKAFELVQEWHEHVDM